MPARKTNAKDLFSQSALQQKVSLSSLSEMTGFPIELLKKELLLDGKTDPEEALPLNDLREAMVKFLNKTLVEIEGLQ